MEKAGFAAGCFWQVEETFRRVPGVSATRVGYQGGEAPNPTYGDVCSGATGHTETLEIDFDPEQVSYEQLLELFWQVHDPTQLNRQGPDVGTQYRSAIFFHSAEQEAAAQASKAAVQSRFSKDVMTEIVAAPEFFSAEDYHQRYIEKRQAASYSY